MQICSIWGNIILMKDDVKINRLWCMSHNYNQRKNRTSETCFAQMRSDTTGKIQKLWTRFNPRWWLLRWIPSLQPAAKMNPIVVIRWRLGFVTKQGHPGFVFWMNSQVRSTVHCSSSILYVDLLPKMRLWVMEKTPSSLGFCFLFTNPSTNWWIWKIEIFMFCLVNSCTCFFEPWAGRCLKDNERQ